LHARPTAANNRVIRTISSIELNEARHIVDEGIRVAAGDGGKPVVVAVSDHNGDLVAFSRMDGAPVRSVAIATNKAYTAARTASTTAALAKRLKDEGRDVLVYGDPRFSLFPVGISGRSAEEDQQLADRIASLPA
jgi:uncharacterized protein GlcG (DUF336 family)